jgi:hypothetical protein
LKIGKKANSKEATRGKWSLTKKVYEEKVAPASE